MDAPWSLAIDFGTSNTAAAHTNPVTGAVETVSLTHESHTIASHVYAEDSSTFSTDSTALNQAERDPEGFIPAPKRHIQNDRISVRGEAISVPMVISAVVCEVIKRASRQHNNQPPAHLMLTHPEQWSSADINRLRTAAVLADVPEENISLMSEAKAAVYYYTKANALVAGEKIAVFDFGGGTLDIAVLTANADGSFQIVSHEGNNALGGRSFDAQIKDWLYYQLEDIDPDLLDYIRDEASSAERIALDEQIQKVKELLTDNPAATITIQNRGGQAFVQLTRGEFNSIISGQLREAVALAKHVLENAGVYTPADLKAIYLTGGSSRVPAVQEALKILGPVQMDNPKTVVSLGALQAMEDLGQSAFSETPAPPQEPVAEVHAPKEVPVSPQPTVETAPGGEETLVGADEAPVESSTSDHKSNRKKLLIAGAAVLALGAGVFALIDSRDSGTSTVASSRKVPVTSSVVASSRKVPVTSSAVTSTEVMAPSLRDPLEEVNKDTLLERLKRDPIMANKLRLDECELLEQTDDDPVGVLCPFKREISEGLTPDGEDLKVQFDYLGEGAGEVFRSIWANQNLDNYGDQRDPDRHYQRTFLSEDNTQVGRLALNQNYNYFYTEVAPISGGRYRYFQFADPEAFATFVSLLDTSSSN